MSELVLRTDVLAPENIKTISFEGFHPSRLMKVMPDLIKEILRIESPALYEDQFKWDISGDPITFYGVWRGNKGLDKMSSFSLLVVVQGKQNAKDKNGAASVSIRGIINTKLPEKTAFHKIANYAYLYGFYADQRREYVRRSKIEMEKVEDEIKSLFNLLERTRD